jgi:hypothetical protein
MFNVLYHYAMDLFDFAVVFSIDGRDGRTKNLMVTMEIIFP